MIYKKGDSVADIVEEEIHNLVKFFDRVTIRKNFISLTSYKHGYDCFTVWCTDVTYKGGTYPYTHISFKYDADLDEYGISISDSRTDSMIIFKFM